MTLEELRNHCLAKPDVTEGTPFGPDTLVFKVNGKIFLITGFDHLPLQFNVKCDPIRAEELREEYACVQPGYHMNKTHWNTVIVDGTVATNKLREWIDHSYDLIRSSTLHTPRKASAKKKSATKKSAAKKIAPTKKPTAKKAVPQKKSSRRKKS